SRAACKRGCAMSSDLPAVLVGATFAERYLIERELGRGGSAVVYLARDVKHNRRVAIKVLHSELTTTAARQRFVSEIAIVAQLTHPHILPLYDSGDIDGCVYYVMPHVDGESLRDKLAREHQLSLQDAVRIAREAADALAYAHSNG